MSPKNTRVAGHELQFEGAAYVRTGNYYSRLLMASTGGRGVGKCSCGAVSEMLDSGNKRKQWHRGHKTAIQALASTEIPIGTPVRYWPGIRQGEGRESVTRTPVWDVCGTPCVTVEGYSGGIALTHIEIISEGSIK